MTTMCTVNRVNKHILVIEVFIMKLGSLTVLSIIIDRNPSQTEAEGRNVLVYIGSYNQK